MFYSIHLSAVHSFTLFSSCWSFLNLNYFTVKCPRFRKCWLWQLKKPKLLSHRDPSWVRVLKGHYGFSKPSHRSSKDYIFNCGHGMIIILRRKIWASSPWHQRNASHFWVFCSRQLICMSLESSLGLCDKKPWSWLDCLSFAMCSFPLILRKVLTLIMRSCTNPPGR